MLYYLYIKNVFALIKPNSFCCQMQPNLNHSGGRSITASHYPSTNGDGQFALIMATEN